MKILRLTEKKSSEDLKTIIFPESEEERVLKAVDIILKKKIAKVILIQKKKRPDIKIKPNTNLIIIDEDFSFQFLEIYHKIKLAKKPEYKISQSESDIRNSITFACLLLKGNFADGIIAGSVYSTSEVLRNAISIVGLEKNNKTVSSFFLLHFPWKSEFKKRVLAFADCGVIPEPDYKQLSDIALQTAGNYLKLTGITPRVAFLSFSTKGSAADSSLEKIIKAYNLTRKRKPDLICDGELQFDTAFVPEVAKRKNPDGIIKGDANIFIFPDLNSGNIAYKLAERIGGASATGPVVQGLAKPVMDLSRGCSSEDIINMSIVVNRMITVKKNK